MIALPLVCGWVQDTLSEDALSGATLGGSGASGARAGRVKLSELGDHSPGPAVLTARTWMTSVRPPGSVEVANDALVIGEAGCQSVQLAPLSEE